MNTLGVLYVLENGNEVTDIASLKGKTIYSTGAGATPQYVLEYILEKNGIDPKKDVTIEYLSEHAELAAKLAAGEVSIGVLPEPNVTSALINGKGNLRIALDITSEWDKVSTSKLAQGCIVVSNKFRREHPEAYKAVVSELAASVEYVNANNEEASKLIEKCGIIPKQRPPSPRRPFPTAISASSRATTPISACRICSPCFLRQIPLLSAASFPQIPSTENNTF